MTVAVAAAAGAAGFTILRLNISSLFFFAILPFGDIAFCDSTANWLEMNSVVEHLASKIVAQLLTDLACLLVLTMSQLVDLIVSAGEKVFSSRCSVILLVDGYCPVCARGQSGV